MDRCESLRKMKQNEKFYYYDKTKQHRFSSYIRHDDLVQSIELKKKKLKKLFKNIDFPEPRENQIQVIKEVDLNSSLPEIVQVPKIDGSPTKEV